MSSQISALLRRFKKTPEKVATPGYPHNEVIDEDEINEMTNLNSGSPIEPVRKALSHEGDIPVFSLGANSISDLAATQTQPTPPNRHDRTEDSERESPIHKLPTSGTISDMMEFESLIELKRTSNRPKESKLSQQQLRAWKPMLTPKFVIHLFLISSLIFIPIGILLYFESNNIYEFEYDYTDCRDINNPNRTCHQQLEKDINYECKCRIDFYEERFQYQTLNVYYKLTNFFQNQRRFEKSKDNRQLTGGEGQLSDDCNPYRYKTAADGAKLKYAPCGAAANSMFNDTFSVYYRHMQINETVKLNISKVNIAWDTDRKYKYKNPKNFSGTIKPPNWAFNITEMPNGFQNEDLIVWMRTAAFPTFKKLYGRILLEENSILLHPSSHLNDTSYLLRYFENFYENQLRQVFINMIRDNQTKFELDRHSKSSSIHKYRLPKGDYFVEINFKYPVRSFRGRKYFILANTSWIGGKCFFMAITYFVLGVVCFITTFVLFFLNFYNGHMDENGAKFLMESYGINWGPVASRRLI